MQHDSAIVVTIRYRGTASENLLIVRRSNLQRACLPVVDVYVFDQFSCTRCLYRDDSVIALISGVISAKF